MSFPAARMTSTTAHGGTVTLGTPLTLIGNLPAARMGDMQVCPMVTVLVPHVGGPIVFGAFNVLTGNLPQARMLDMCTCVGPPGIIVTGHFQTLVGMAGGFAGAIGGFLGLLSGSLLAGLQNLLGGGYPRARMQPDGSYITEYSEHIRLRGTPEQQARNIRQLNAIRNGVGGAAFLDEIDARGQDTFLNVIGDPARGSELFPGQQSYENCVPQSVQQLIHQATGVNNSESQMEQVANNPNNSGYNRATGTPDTGIETELENGGVPAHLEPANTGNIDRALANNQGVVTPHDAGALWNDSDYSGHGHAVNTTGAIQDENGRTLGYVINDTGTGESTRTVPADTYQRTLLPVNMGVTDNPVW